MGEGWEDKDLLIKRGTMITPLQQNLLVERNNETSEVVQKKSGILVPGTTQSLQDEALIIGEVIYAPKDQNMLLDKTRPINDVELKPGDKIWYSKYSTARILDDREGNEGNLLDIVPLEDVRAVQS